MAETTADRLNNFIDETGCPAVAVAALCKISQPVLSNYRTGVLQPSSGDAKKIDKTVSRLLLRGGKIVCRRGKGSVRTTQARTEPSTVNGGAVMLPWVEKPSLSGDGVRHTLLRDGYPQTEIDWGGADYVRFWTQEVEESTGTK